MQVEHQDWNNVVFTNKTKKTKNESSSLKKPKIDDANKEIKYEAPKLGQTILQARTANNKNQKQLANELGISVQILSRWELNKELPDNKQISNMEKVLKVKLPRVKKVNLDA